jgi:hypothetical protein
LRAHWGFAIDPAAPIVNPQIAGQSIINNQKSSTNQQSTINPQQMIPYRGTKARNLQGLSTRIWRSIPSLIPALISIGPNTVAA